MCVCIYRSILILIPVEFSDVRKCSVFIILCIYGISTDSALHVVYSHDRKHYVHNNMAYASQVNRYRSILYAAYSESKKSVPVRTYTCGQRDGLSQTRLFGVEEWKTGEVCWCASAVRALSRQTNDHSVIYYIFC